MEILATEAASQQRMFMTLEDTSDRQSFPSQQNFTLPQVASNVHHITIEPDLPSKVEIVRRPLGGKHVSTLQFDPSKVNKGFIKKEPDDVHEEHETEDRKIVFSCKKEEVRRKEFLCPVCNDNFPTSLSLQAHSQIHAVKNESSVTGDLKPDVKMEDGYNHSRKKRFKCNICCRSFYNITSLKGHMKIHSGEAPFRCVYCEKRFTHGRNLHRHLNAAHKDQFADSASLCNKLFQTTYATENRLVIYTGEKPKPFKCAICSKTFRKLYRVNEHTRTHSDQKAYQCSACNKQFNSSDNLYRHVKRLHNNLLTTPQDAAPKMEPVLENQTVVEINPMNSEMQQDINQINLLADIAQQAELLDISRSGVASYNNNATYYIDVRSEYGEPLQVQHIPHTQQIPHMQQQQQTHTEQEQIHGTSANVFQCSICRESFQSMSLLNRHLGTHKVQVPSKCSICQKEFKNDTDLKRHMLTHSGEKPFKCSLCPKAFKRPYRLSNHWRVHTGEKPYQCSVCGKLFTVSDNMYRHIKKMHNGEGLTVAVEMVRKVTDMNRAKKYNISQETINELVEDHNVSWQQNQNVVNPM